MSERVQAAAKKPETKRENKVSQTQKTGPSQSISSPVEQILLLQRTIGNQAVEKLIKSGALQAKLKIGQPGDIYEQEADRVAEQVMRMPEPKASNETGVSNPALKNSIQRKCPGCNKGTKVEKEDEGEKLQKKEVAGSTHEFAPELESSISAVRGGGQPLTESVRAFHEPRFGADFGQVRVHTDAKAAEAASSVNALAYTVGTNVVFGAAQYAPETFAGRRLLAHELTHVVQQGRQLSKRIQKASLSDFNDNNPLHDPSRLSDAQIRATDEYLFISTYTFPPLIQPYATQEEALLASRLLLRHLREGGSIIPFTNDLAQQFIDRAKRQLGTLRSTEPQVGTLNWVPFSTGAAVSNPSALPTEFGRWILAGGREPHALSGSINCWEMVLFGAYKGRYITFPRIQQIYNLAVQNVRSGRTRLVGDTVETELRRGNENIFNPTNPNSPKPLPGDIVIFNRAAVHTAIALGTMARGEQEVLSLWNRPNNISNVQRTTIEALLAEMGPGQGMPVRFWSAKW